MKFYFYIFTFSLLLFVGCKVRFLLFDLFDDFEMSIEIKIKRNIRASREYSDIYDLYSKVTK